MRCKLHLFFEAAACVPQGAASTLLPIAAAISYLLYAQLNYRIIECPSLQQAQGKLQKSKDKNLLFRIKPTFVFEPHQFTPF
jgi:hypothetical protein